MKHLFIIIDSLSSDYLKKSKMDFVKKFSKNNKSFTVKMSPSFANRYEITTGKTSRQNNVLFDIVRGKSPYSKISKISKFSTDFKQRKISMRWILMILFRTNFNPVNIPSSFLPLFCEDERMEKLRMLERKRSDQGFLSMLEKKWIDTEVISGPIEDIEYRLKSTKSDFVFVHYTRPDILGHVYGPDSKEYAEEMKDIDKSIKKIIKENEGVLENVFITSDHDMVKVKENINLWSELTKTKSKIVKDYVFFINSPVARFWFKNQSSKKEIKLLLSKMEKRGYGRIMKKSYFEKYSISEDKRFGDLIFWLNPGYSFSPDFYMGLESAKGMHGYLEFSKLPLIVKSRKKIKKSPKYSKDIINMMNEIFGG